MIINQALVSVSDKEGIVEFCSFLASNAINLLATGGTYNLLKESKIKVKEISQYTNYPEILDGRVKTLHPKIHGGILARGSLDEAVLQKHNISVINLVVVNLYPFEDVIAQPSFTHQKALDNIDIGGVTLLRAAAKNYNHCLIVTDKNDYQEAQEKIATNSITEEFRLAYAIKAIQATSKYDDQIQQYLSNYKHKENKKVNNDDIPKQINLNLKLKKELRYGENPHQFAGLYTDATFNNKLHSEGTIANSKQHTGKALSFNNIVDAETAWECVSQFEDCACVLVKHANPCGVAIDLSPLDAYKKAHSADPKSAFGSVIAFNHSLELETVKAMLANQFVEIIIAPEMKFDTSQLVTNVRLLSTHSKPRVPQLSIKSVNGGFLVQQTDKLITTIDDFKVVSEVRPTPKQIQDCYFAWKIVLSAKSNAIVIANNKQTVGIGCGQTTRIDSLKNAITRAQEVKFPLENTVMASDAFFPFPDCVNLATQFGINCIIQPGGSKNDYKVIEAVNNNKQVMIVTNIRHFKH